MSGKLREALKPCPFCGAHLVERGDYTSEGGWNWFQHDEDSKCLIADVHVPVVWNGPQTGAERWNARAALAAEEESGWRTIDSAPKDGTWFLAGSPHHVGLLRWNAEEEIHEDEHREFFDAAQNHITHWQPLPAPPSPKDKTP